MRELFRLAFAPWLILMVFGAVMARPLFLAIAGLGIGFTLVKIVMDRVRRERLESGLDVLAPPDRSQLAPVRRLLQEIEALVAAHRGSPSIAVIGPEAVTEARHVHEQCVRLLKLRREMRRALADAGSVAGEIASLEQRLSVSKIEGERAALESALDARRLEGSHFAKMEDVLATVEGGLVQAQAALSEIKARLSVAAAEDRVGEGAGDELREALGRVRALSKGFEEAEAFLKDQVT